MLAFVGDAEKFKILKKSIVMADVGNKIKVVKKKTRLQVMLRFPRKLRLNKYLLSNIYTFKI